MIVTKYCEDGKKYIDIKECSSEHFGGYHLRKNKKIWLCKKHRPKNCKIMDEYTGRIVGEKRNNFESYY